MNLTKREKFLLTFLGVLVVGCVFAFLIFTPLITSINTNKAQTELLEAQKYEMDLILAKYGQLEPEINELTNKANDELEFLMPKMANEDLSTYVMNIVKEHDILVLMYDITDPVITDVDPLLTAEEEQTDGPTTYTIKDYLMSLKENTEEQEVTKTFSSITLEKAEINMSFNGTYEQYSKLIDSIRSTGKSIFITSSNKYLNEEGTYDCDLTIAVYMTEGLE